MGLPLLQLGSYCWTQPGCTDNLSAPARNLHPLCCKWMGICGI